MKTNLFKCLLAAALVVAVSTAAYAQTYVSIPLPITTAAGVASTGYSTNLSGGWTNTTYVTNITTTWNSTTAAIVNTTNIVTNSILTYADFNAVGRPWVTIQVEQGATAAAATSNEVLVVARSLTGGRFDTLNNVSITNQSNGNTPSVGLYQLDMRGYPYGRVVSFRFEDTATGHSWTNLGVYYTGPSIHQGGSPYGN